MAPKGTTHYYDIWRNATTAEIKMKPQPQIIMYRPKLSKLNKHNELYLSATETKRSYATIKLLISNCLN